MPWDTRCVRGGLCRYFTLVPGAVELYHTTFSTKATWLTHDVYETKGVSPYNGWLLRFIGLGLGYV